MLKLKIEDIIAELNEHQKEVINSDSPNVLITAGPGSGKSKVIIARTAKLIESGVPPYKICLVTFTNKAANELRERLDKVIENSHMVTVGTFHSVCLILLKKYGSSIGLKNFSILSSYESKTIIKNIMKDKGIPFDKKKVNHFQTKLSSFKSDLVSVKKAIAVASSDDERETAMIYEEYQNRNWKSKSLDFDDLLLYCYIMLIKNPDVIEKLPYEYLSVDECQDSNHIQLELSKLICQENKHYLGDIDQSIYSWRGARPDSFLNFNGDILHLNRNYRSTKNIVEASMSVIKNNKKRVPMQLYTENPVGDKITLAKSTDKFREATYVANEIKHLINAGVSPGDIAIFYRTNKQNMVLENTFSKWGIDYKIIGGISFFDRIEIKDIMAYLRLIVNRKDDLALERLLKATPGIGLKTIEKMKEDVLNNGKTLLHQCKSFKFSAKQRQSVEKLFAILRVLDGKKDGLTSELISDVVDLTKVIDYYSNSKNPEDKERVENIREFINVAKNMESKRDDYKVKDFIDDISLSTMKEAGGKDCVSLMTLHSSKGLEYPYIFMIGCNDGVIPHMNSKHNTGEFEEERRLFYVGMTRAKKKLYISTFDSSTDKFAKNISRPSNFISEIPKHLLTEEYV